MSSWRPATAGPIRFATRRLRITTLPALRKRRRQPVRGPRDARYPRPPQTVRRPGRRSCPRRHSPSNGVPDVARALRFEVRGVGLGDAIDSGSAVDSVDLRVEGHLCLPRVVAGRDSQSVRTGSRRLHRGHLPKLRAPHTYLSWSASRRRAGLAPRGGGAVRAYAAVSRMNGTGRRWRHCRRVSRMSTHCWTAGGRRNGRCVPLFSCGESWAMT